MRESVFRPISESTVFVLCPSELVTGGAELLHQLVDYLVRNGRDAKIVYTPVGIDARTPASYLCYRCPVATRLDDQSDVAVVVPEVSTEHLAGVRLARKVVWWLSVDNYAGGLHGRSELVQYLVRRLRPKVPASAAHLFQSAYAEDFVWRRFRCRGAMLTDYVAEEFFSGPTGALRRNIVAYNPRKGLEYTRRVMAAFPEIAFLPLQGMNREQLCRALDECKVYIDFGSHPGKDRMPREAAARGAVVLVGLRGAARFHEDVALPASYKLPSNASSIRHLGLLLTDVFDRFGWHQAQQLEYRQSIWKERRAFERQAALAFNIER